MTVHISVGVLQDKSLSSRILEDNFEVLGLSLGLESRVLGLALVTQVLGKTHQSLHFLHRRLQGQQLRILSVTDY